MVSKEEVEHIAAIADIGIDDSELELFTSQFNEIIGYFDILDSIEEGLDSTQTRHNVFREDVPLPSLSQEDALLNSTDPEDGFIRAPRVI
ncbi:MAG: Asp-tRNA(Asn)/Glu-tRNA(Gln) amidotransferase subunit GatC [Methanocalculus sp. MSAO_Arc1]|uniref:Asp-tRNA(Asn)/Glu-tRNA(Gln) amidotransferase subunit GatC n=1 Tax=Methanocalculus TaxID=71151 RepID=UPI000FEDE235|nr:MULTISPECIES: Asp-tRNA(Asn)/Glu-tRNA(Gln) amidotransferase subunit GatC [unclassified Methanocalculus]MCP1661906.1 aspartyl-tRNA(Asn)/glutamyl-tRNA(Gln) amidotransferase subunit C [Methanocalculus sp. AMF5]RQD81208.1 MAG: Asp-tRNA(Asn)/Glu-tRNA(Gln) amidotransferase subunit GatC [Methanocalculus sp. MSAO_Arc1]